MKKGNTGTLLKFIARRLVYSFFVMTGVLILTFVLFRIASGDPARAILGKNPSPKEVEQLRIALGSGKPLLYGHWRKTEIYTSTSFKHKRTLKGIKYKGDTELKHNSLILNKNSSVFFKPNFEFQSIRLKLNFTFAGSINVNSVHNGIFKKYSFKSPALKTVTLVFNTPPGEISFTTPAEAELKNVLFQRYQKSAFDSQLFDAFKELVSFKDQFPYISFFNFGNTLVSKEPVNKVLSEGIWPSLSLMIPIFAGELIIGIIFAMTAVAFQNKFPDKILMLISVAGMSISYIVFMIAGQYIFAYYYHIFPIWGFENYKYIILPVIIGVISGAGGGIRFYRTIFINELKKEYLRTARSKGLSPLSIYFKHLMKNAAVPIITRSAAVLPFLFTGSLLLESFFGIPGLGYAGINALMNSDIQLLKAIVIMTALLFIVINTAADIINAWADPRVSL